MQSWFDFYLKDVLKKNSFLTTLFDKCIKMFLNKQFTQKIVEHTVPKKEVFIVLPYLGMSIFKPSARLAKFFRFKMRYLCV